MHRTALVTVVTAALTTLLLVSLAAAQTGAFAGLKRPRNEPSRRCTD